MAHKISQAENTTVDRMYNQKAIFPRSPTLNHFKMPDRRIRPQQNKESGDIPPVLSYSLVAISTLQVL